MSKPRTPRDASPRRRATPTPAAVPAARLQRLRRPETGLVRAVYQDDDGRRWTVLVPPGREAQASMGIVVGPPNLSAMGLPPAVALRLHNELQGRGLLTLTDIRGRPGDVFSALQAALRLDVATISNLYAQAEAEAHEGDEDNVQ